MITSSSEMCVCVFQLDSRRATHSPQKKTTFFSIVFFGSGRRTIERTKRTIFFLSTTSAQSRIHTEQSVDAARRVVLVSSLHFRTQRSRYSKYKIPVNQTIEWRATGFFLFSIRFSFSYSVIRTVYNLSNRGLCAQCSREKSERDKIGNLFINFYLIFLLLILRSTHLWVDKSCRHRGECVCAYVCECENQKRRQK